MTGADCAESVCTGGQCAAPSCFDGVKNGGEVGPDCGLVCGFLCEAGGPCQGDDECVSLLCVQGVCAASSCSDMVKNGAESDVDCGGGCAPCADGLACGVAGDCGSSVCTGGLCQVGSCADGVKNGMESGTDCGGPCVQCPDGEGCAVAIDCQSGVCTASSCSAPSCSDGVKNGAELDTDCGGPCGPCDNGQKCSSAAGCLSRECTLGVCVASVGCSDLTRITSGKWGTFANIALCSGGWSVPGVRSPASMVPACDRMSGGTSSNPSGNGCSVADLCQYGWHVCTDAVDVILKADNTAGVCSGGIPTNAFFVTRQGDSDGGAACDGLGNDDVFGCGASAATGTSNCGALNRYARSKGMGACDNLSGVWDCGPGPADEALLLTKQTPLNGGAMCCRD
jgi:hypothetical protein